MVAHIILHFPLCTVHMVSFKYCIRTLVECSTCDLPSPPLIASFLLLTGTAPAKEDWPPGPRAAVNTCHRTRYTPPPPPTPTHLPPHTHSALVCLLHGMSYSRLPMIQIRSCIHTSCTAGLIWKVRYSWAHAKSRHSLICMPRDCVYQIVYAMKCIAHKASLVRLPWFQRVDYFLGPSQIVLQCIVSAPLSSLWRCYVNDTSKNVVR